uniref:DNA replication regulator SLD2 n=2 Tax=Kluyveromyces lactis TaxID=28985 RepID=SLD2_KLULA|nr:RecName: Full=DNA replication regulator SLD2 [Kluyveromyces lactis NRRL Y-1140]
MNGIKETDTVNAPLLLVISSASMDALKIEIKLWERAFEKEHGRLPEKDDIKKDKEVKRKYKQYAQLKKDATVKPSVEVNVEQTPVKSHVNNTKAEFGPTPQMNGKLVSIFEMQVSAMKTHQSDQEDIVGSPVRSNDLVRRQLNFSITPNSSPMKQVPNLSANIVVSRPKYGPNSPMRIGDIGLQLSETPKTLGRTLDLKSSPFSPSPLIKRPVKTLSQLAKEHAIIKDEFESNPEDFSEFTAIRTLMEKLMQEEHMDIIEEGDEGTVGNETESNYVRKVKTIKKRTKAKMRPAALNEKSTNIPDKNVHEQLAKLKEREYNKMLGKEVEESESDSEQQSNPPVKKKQRKSKYNLVSNNFKRLNLPTKAGRNRASKWRGRR